MADTLHPVKDAARQLGISVWTLRKKAYDGEIASAKIGVKLLIPASEIDRLIREGMRPRRTGSQTVVAGELSRPHSDPKNQTKGIPR